MIWLIAYIIGFIITFITLIAIEHRIANKVLLYEPSYRSAFGWSVIWPLSWLLMIIGLFFR